MTEYRIEHFNNSFACLMGNDTILIATGDLNMLSDSEVIEYISDGLMHEHIHLELYKLFNNIVSKLFDGIEYLFRNEKLSEKAMPSNRESYITYIKRVGFEKFLEYYGLCKYDVTDANTLCNTRNLIPTEINKLFDARKETYFRRQIDKLPK